MVKAALTTPAARLLPSPLESQNPPPVMSFVDVLRMLAALAADKNGYVKLPNVEPLVEALDMKEAQRAYEANLNVIEAARSMQQRTLDLLKQ